MGSNDIDADMDKQETYAAVKAMTFASEEAAYLFYNKYAKEHGFSIRHEKIKKHIDKLGGFFAPEMGHVKAST
jgi:hypothetical protein